MSKPPRPNVPDWVKRLLRREVGFGCPICRSPIVEYHHFDPPYREFEPPFTQAKVHDPKGMICLCLKCHKAADAGSWSKEYLRDVKQRDYSTSPVKEHFPSWTHRTVLWRLGGNYIAGAGAFIKVAGRPVVWVSRHECGLMLLSFDLFAADGTPVATMRDNAFECDPEQISELIVKHDSGGIGLHSMRHDVRLGVSFRRLSVEEIAELVDQDYCRANPRAQSLPKERREGENLVGAGIREWLSRGAAREDGRVPFLNFDELSSFHEGHELLVHDAGVRVGHRAGLRLEYNFAVDADAVFDLAR